MGYWVFVLAGLVREGFGVSSVRGFGVQKGLTGSHSLGQNGLTRELPRPQQRSIIRVTYRAHRTKRDAVMLMLTRRKHAR